MFQYPLADRVGFWGVGVGAPLRTKTCFSILLRIELVFGASVRCHVCAPLRVSVSSCGSSWFLGLAGTIMAQKDEEFQYPLADRVGFWGSMPGLASATVHGFSILLRIELVFGARTCRSPAPCCRVSVSSCGSSWFLGVYVRQHLADADLCFSILLRIELVFGGRSTNSMPCSPLVSVSSCGSSWFLGRHLTRWHATHLSVSVSSCGSSWFLGFPATRHAAHCVTFQYPLADRVGFWGD